MTGIRRHGSRRAYSSGWPAYAAFGWALAFALISLYWTLGGELALDTIGGQLERAVRTREPAMTVVLAVVTLVKALGAVFALALARPWGRVIPRGLMAFLGWAGSALLILYGGVLTGGEALIELGALPAESTMDRTAFLGHLYVWDPWFLVWGVLLGLAMLRFSRSR